MTKDQKIQQKSELRMRRVNITGLSYEKEQLKSDNVKLSGLIESLGEIKQRLSNEIQRNSKLMEINLIRQFEIEDTLNDYQ